jgi:hypothetical protein
LRLVFTAVVLVRHLLTGSLRSFIHGLRRSHITSPRDLVSRYGGHPVTVPRMSEERILLSRLADFVSAECRGERAREQTCSTRDHKGDS